MLATSRGAKIANRLQSLECIVTHPRSLAGDHGGDVSWPFGKFRSKLLDEVVRVAKDSMLKCPDKLTRLSIDSRNNGVGLELIHQAPTADGLKQTILRP